MVLYSVQDFLYQLESAGIFDFLLPFLLIFAVVFGILMQMKIFSGSKGVNVIIALVIGMLSVRFNFFNQFYAEIFPRLGVGITVVLAILILLGIFIPQQHRAYWFWGLAGIALVIAIVVLYQTFSVLGWVGYGYFGDATIGWIVFGLLIASLIIAVAASSGGGNSSNTMPLKDLIWNGLFGDGDRGKQ